MCVMVGRSVALQDLTTYIKLAGVQGGSRACIDPAMAGRGGMAARPKRAPLHLRHLLSILFVQCNCAGWPVATQSYLIIFKKKSILRTFKVGHKLICIV